MRLLRFLIFLFSTGAALAQGLPVLNGNAANGRPGQYQTVSDGGMLVWSNLPSSSGMVQTNISVAAVTNRNWVTNFNGAATNLNVYFSANDPLTIHDPAGAGANIMFKAHGTNYGSFGGVVGAGMFMANQDQSSYILLDPITGAFSWTGIATGNGSGITALNASALASGTAPLARGGTGASLTDPNADRILFWDDSAGALTWLTAGSGLSISGTTLTATGGGGGGETGMLTNQFTTNVVGAAVIGDLRLSGNLIFDGTSLRMSNSFIYAPNISDGGSVAKYLWRANDGEVRTTTSGAALTDLNASALASGLIDPRRLSPTNGASDGYALTLDNGTNKWSANGGASDGRGWDTNGNSGLAEANFVGTLDNVSLQLRSSNATLVRIDGYSNTVILGKNNRIVGWQPHSTIGGGQGNLITGATNSAFHYLLGYNVLGGGATNSINEGSGVLGRSFIGGGFYNSTVNSDASALVIVGGGQNTNEGSGGFIGGGYLNFADAVGTDSNANFASIPGGYVNRVVGDYGTASGGRSNTVTGPYGTVPGGYQNQALGSNSFAAGFKAQATHPGSFVWSDVSSGSAFASAADNEFSVRASGGVRLGVGTPNQGASVSPLGIDSSGRITTNGVIVNGSIVETNFVLNTVFTNTSGGGQIIAFYGWYHLAAVSGAAALDLMVAQDGGLTFSRGAGFGADSSATTIAMDYTNSASWGVSNGARFYLTNSSFGAGNTAALLSGQRITIGGSVTGDSLVTNAPAGANEMIQSTSATTAKYTASPDLNAAWLTSGTVADARLGQKVTLAYTGDSTNVFWDGYTYEEAILLLTNHTILNMTNAATPSGFMLPRKLLIVRAGTTAWNLYVTNTSSPKFGQDITGFNIGPNTNSSAWAGMNWNSLSNRWDITGNPSGY